MADVFVSHVEEDAALALRIADALEGAGYSTWCYERDSVPGPSYLVQTGQAVEACQAVVVVISPHSLGSHQVTVEVVRGHEASKPFVPVLVGLAHVELAARQPEWREAIGSATSVTVPPGGVEEILPRVVSGLQALGVRPSGPVERGAYVPVPFVAPRRGGLAPRLRALPRAVWFAAAAVLVVLVVGLLLLGRGGGPREAADVTPTWAPDSSTAPLGPTAMPVPSRAVDASSTPLLTNVGDARVRSAVLTDEFCPPPGFPGACKHPAQNRYLVLTFEGWGGGSLSIWMTQDSNESYVLVDGHRYNPTSQADETNGVVRVVYGGVPASTAGSTAELVWPRNPRLRVRITT